jgi:signal peptidase
MVTVVVRDTGAAFRKDKPMEASNTASASAEVDDDLAPRTGQGSTALQRSLVWSLRGLLIVVCIAAGCLTILPAALGLQRYVVTGTAMNGTIGKGSVVFDRVVPTSSLKVGDVITYQPPAGVKVSGNRVTDRIVSMTKSADGRTIFQTKGDSDAANDPWTFYLAGSKQAEVAMHIPYVGVPLGLLATRLVRIGVIAGILVLIALRIAIGLFIEGAERKGRHAVERELREINGEPIATAEASVDVAATSSTDTDTDEYAPDGDAEVSDELLDASRSAALAALIAASSVAASSRGLNDIHAIPTQDTKRSTRAAS